MANQDERDWDKRNKGLAKKCFEIVSDQNSPVKQINAAKRILDDRNFGGDPNNADLKELGFEKEN